MVSLVLPCLPNIWSACRNPVWSRAQWKRTGILEWFRDRRRSWCTQSQPVDSLWIVVKSEIDQDNVFMLYYDLTWPDNSYSCPTKKQSVQSINTTHVTQLSKDLSRKRCSDHSIWCPAFVGALALHSRHTSLNTTVTMSIGRIQTNQVSLSCSLGGVVLLYLTLSKF